METVISRDGTAIAFERSGQGPALILVNGALSTRIAGAQLAARLAPHFTVFAYDRRGRGDSGDTKPYAVECEIEDMEALIDLAGREAFVFGHSSGAILSLEAALMLPTKITKLALYEPPFIIDDSRPLPPPDYVTHLDELIATNRRGDAVTYFMTMVVGTPAPQVTQMQNMPMWAAMEAAAPTLPYDSTISQAVTTGSPLPLRKWASVAIPALVMDGGASPAFMHHAAEALTAILPDAQHRRFPGQSHSPANDLLVPVLVDFFKS